MPEKSTIERARRDKEEGKSASTQAGEFVREEIDHIREGKHGARSTKQAVAIGLSKARRAGVDLPPYRKSASSGRTPSRARRSGESSTKRARASLKALKREGSNSASKTSLSKFAKSTARKRGPQARHQSAGKATRTRTHKQSPKSR